MTGLHACQAIGEISGSNRKNSATYCTSPRAVWLVLPTAWSHDQWAGMRVL